MPRDTRETMQNLFRCFPAHPMRWSLGFEKSRRGPKWGVAYLVRYSGGAEAHCNSNFVIAYRIDGPAGKHSQYVSRNADV